MEILAGFGLAVLVGLALYVGWGFHFLQRVEDAEEMEKRLHKAEARAQQLEEECSVLYAQLHPEDSRPID